jgi:hypothetical protein
MLLLSMLFADASVISAKTRTTVEHFQGGTGALLLGPEALEGY